MTDSSGSRRNFLRGILGRAAREAASRVPDSLTDAAREATREDFAARRLSAEDLARAFTVSEDQRDIAELLVTRQALIVTQDGRFVEPRGVSRVVNSLGAATGMWLERARTGDVIDRGRARDAMLLETVRAELRDER
jgi:hypothetical protein